MHSENLNYIEDDKKRKLYYRFTPAALFSNFVPLIVILENEENAEASHFEYKMWNVLTPIMHFGDEKELLPALIHQIAEEHECEEHIYFYGRGRGGYEAILQGMLCQANAIYADTPQLKSEETASRKSDLNAFLNPHDAFPIFYLCDNQTSLQGSNEIAHFVEACKQNTIKVQVENCPNTGYNISQSIKEVLNFFERVASEK